VEYWYNTTFHQSISITPFQALYGIPPPTVINYLSQASVVEEVEKESQEREELMRQLKENLNKAGNYMKYQADNNWQDYELENGEWVYFWKMAIGFI
jgi:hypothetical protein